MSNLIAAVKRTFTSRQDETHVHFHQGTTRAMPEVCFEGACERPRLQVR